MATVRWRSRHDIGEGKAVGEGMIVGLGDGMIVGLGDGMNDGDGLDHGSESADGRGEGSGPEPPAEESVPTNE